MQTQEQATSQDSAGAAGSACLGASAERGWFLILSGAAPADELERIRDLLGTRLDGFGLNALPDWIDFQVQVADAFEASHRQLRASLEAAGFPPEVDLGSSCSLILCRGKSYQLAHLGRGRPALYSRRFLRPLTKEHTQAFSRYEKGELKLAELPGHPESLQLTRGLGIPEDDAMMATAAAFRRGELKAGDQLVLPGGDLMDFLEEGDLLEVLEDDADVEAAAAALATKAREAGALGPACGLLRIGEDEDARSWGISAPGVGPPPASPSPAPAPPEAGDDDDGAAATGGEPSPPDPDPDDAPRVSPLALDDLDLPDLPDLPALPEEDDDVPDIPPKPPFPAAAIAAALAKPDPVEDDDDDVPDVPPKPPFPAEAIAAALAKPDPVEDEPRPESQPGHAASAPPPPPASDPPAARPPSSPSRPPMRAHPRKVTGPRTPMRTSQVRYPTAEDQRGETWVDIDQDSWADSPFVVGGVLVASASIMTGLLWWRIHPYVVVGVVLTASILALVSWRRSLDAQEHQGRRRPRRKR